MHMRLFHFLTLPLLSLCNNISKVSAPYGTWNLSVSGGFAASGFRWQDMLAEFTYSEHIGAVVIPTITSECNWFYDPRIPGYNPPPGTCNDTSFGYDWPNGGTGVTNITLHQTVKDPEDGTKAVAVTGTSQIEYRCGLNAGRTCAASVVVEAFEGSG
ncbi:hypothetical protein SMACR_07987 [Sordaria macrospora]|uniref:WGS project CABT00000000 data, contig 2.13 n=2 Tax=Sordaria macrospora TaxID=5147 RepID=F7VY41_SORMK|nr:uncharacterized protein SMAC_07987 [Sordaria macrospora k-hell]KAA8629386.1 hypothetical protein SMACR_07987 [Sordaria macrospora]KAH7631557.1 hypothetical protein B0T09DRAFT_407573 [Sordaria sp. MPI-SDFR-AT-0083]WPJ62875.1 hypothetical protein SMAC4_07987 [Sordaria macrospora]CCC10435.1 unnamed protein product [Sordaria macrospora k-hell]